MSNDIETIKAKVTPILKSAGVLRSDVFGSVARGEAKEDSDVDFLVEFPSGKSLFDLADLHMKLEEILHRKVDVLTYRSISPLLKNYIERDRVRIL